MILTSVVDLLLLREEWARVRALVWSDNTLRTKKSQWRRFFKFCSDFDLIPIPATTEVVCLYVTHLTKSVSYVTITHYVSGVWSLHRYLGYDHPDPTQFIIQATIKGAKRLLGAATNPALPLTPEDILAIKGTLDSSSYDDLKFWAAFIAVF